jgi:hypothetical protein
MNEVYPWSPTVKEHDRANVHLYRLTGYIKILYNIKKLNYNLHDITLLHFSVEIFNLLAFFVLVSSSFSNFIILF